MSVMITRNTLKNNTNKMIKKGLTLEYTSKYL